MAGLAKRIAWRKILYSTGIAVGLGLLAFQVWQGALTYRQAQACVARPVYLGAVMASYITAYFVQMAAWALIMRSLQAPLPAQAVVEGYALAFLPRYIPGSVWGYLSRNEWLAQNHQVSYGVSTTASLIEAAMLLVTAGLLGGLFWLPTLWPNPLLPIAILILGLAALWLVWRNTPWLARRIFMKNAATTDQFNRAGVHALALWSATSLLYLFFWGLQGSALVAIAHTLCRGISLSPFAATAAAALSWAIGFLIIFVPAGLGVREWTMSALLVAFTATEPGQASLLAVISRFGLILAEVVVLLIGLHSQLINRWHGRKWLPDDASLE